MDTISMAVLKRATEMEQVAEIHIIGEQLRLRLHEDKIIKDRRRNLRTYPNSFVAREAVDWLIDRKEASDRISAVEIMEKMVEHHTIHHVCDEFKDFRDAKLFYRFTNDDGTFPIPQEVKVIVRGQRIYEKIMAADSSLLQAREEDGVKYERAFSGSDFVTMLIHVQEANSRSAAEVLSRRLLEHAVIQHVTNKHHFVDSALLYQFRINFRRRRRFVEVLIQKPQAVPEAMDSPFCLRKQSQDKSANFHSVGSSNEGKVVPSIRRSSMSASTSASSGFFSVTTPVTTSPPVVLCNPRSVLQRPVTVDELLAPGAPYFRKTLTIVSDAVGWGFVVRGNSPCHIQALDPTGPAAAAGMKTCQFVVSVNGLNVLHGDFRAVSNLILTGPRTIVMEVMEEIKP